MQNPRCTKKSADGKKRIALFLFPLFWLLLVSTNARAEATRRAWIFDQLAQPPEPSTHQQPRHQVGIGGVSYGDALATKAWATADLGVFELNAVGANRFFGQFTPEGTTLASALAPEYRNAAFEIGRFRANPSGTHGRLGLAIMPFFPDGVSYWKFALSTGQLATPDVPYELRISLSFLLSFNHSNDFSLLNMESWRNFYLGGARVLQLGGFFTWAQAVHVADATVTHEFMLLSLGPSAVFKSSLGRLSVGVPLRIWVDKTASGSFLSDFSTPSFSLGWQSFL